MKKNILIIFIIISSLYSNPKRLSFEDVQGKSPFKYTSLNILTWVPNENTYITRIKNTFLKVDIMNSDSSIFLTDEDFRSSNKNIIISKAKTEQAPWRANFTPETFWFDSRGEKILFITNKEKIWRRSFYASYYVMDLKTKKIQSISKNNKKLRNAKFSPDGKQVSYIREDNNIYIYDLIKFKEKKLTTNGSSVILNGHLGWVYEEEFGSYDGYRWSPDSKNIAYWEENQSKVPIFSMFDEISLYPKIKEIRYPKAGEANPTMSIFVINIKKGKRKKMDIGDNSDIYYPWIKWTNKDLLKVMRMNRLQNHWDFLNIKIKNGKSNLGLSESDTSGWVQLHRNYNFLNDGRIVWMSERSGWHHIYIHSDDGELINQVTNGEWEVKQIVKVDEVNQKIYFTANKESIFETRFYSVKFDGSELSLLTNETGSHSVKVLPDGSAFIDSYSSLTSPSKHVLKDMSGNIIKIIHETDKSQFELYDWSYPKIIHFNSTDNTAKLDGIITFPPDYKKGERYPVIVHGYGMPGTQIVNNRWGSTWNQYLAQQGYVVFSMDARGMSGRGEAFKNLSYGDMSKYLAKDTAAGVQHLVDKGIADPDRVGAWGWSGGGYFTGLMLTKNAHLFDVGVSVAPVMDFRLYDSIYTERSMGLPQNNKSGYDSTSVLSYVDRFKGKLLVIHGTGDDNVHSQNTTWLVEEFIKHDKQLDVFYYPNRPHGMSGGNARKNLYRKMIDYFNVNLKSRPLIERRN
jgi:dipeptidyl-peptidase-4